MPADICTKPCSGPIISRSNKWMTGFRFYPTSETEHYQFMIVQIQPAIASDSTDGEIRCTYKAVKKTKVIRRYMEALALYIGATTVHWEYNTSCISVVEAKIVTRRVKHIDIPVCFLQQVLSSAEVLNG